MCVLCTVQCLCVLLGFSLNSINYLFKSISTVTMQTNIEFRLLFSLTCIWIFRRNSKLKSINFNNIRLGASADWQKKLSKLKMLAFTFYRLTLKMLSLSIIRDNRIKWCSLNSSIHWVKRVDMFQLNCVYASGKS